MKLVFNYDFDNLNKLVSACRNNKYGANNIKKKEMDIIRYYTIGMKPITTYPLKITFTWHFETRQRDLDNCIPKNILDSLVKMGKLKNDNLNCITTIIHKSIIDGNNFVEMEIEEDVQKT